MNGGIARQSLEVLDGGGQQELASCAGEPTEPHPGQGEDVLGLAKARLDLLAFDAGGRLSLGLHQGLALCLGMVHPGQRSLRHTGAKFAKPLHVIYAGPS